MRPSKSGVRLLRRPIAGAAARGIFWGFVAPGPLAAVCFAYLCFAFPPGCLSSLRTGGRFPPQPIDAEVSTPELAWALAPVFNGDSILVVASSEGASDAALSARSGPGSYGAKRRSLHEHLNPERAPGAGPEARFMTLTPRGSAVFRTALLLERLSRHFDSSGARARIIVIDNSHYATVGSRHWPDLRTNFPEDASLLHHFRRIPDSGLARIPRYQTQIAKAAARVRATQPHAMFLPGEITVFRAFLGRTLIARARRSLLEADREPEAVQAAERDAAMESDAAMRNPRRGVAARFVPPPGRIAEVRNRKNYPEGFAGTVYGRSIQLLARARRALPDGSKVELILLPLHHRYYRALGLDGRTLERRRRDFVHEYFPEASYADWMADPELHSDSVHYTDAGRARLAKHIRESLR
ncbi:MAG: hypothetical protein RIF32_11675 [Leptospirales bacterium]|jgi:hypothetical protein